MTTNRTKPGSYFLIGSSGISRELEEQGYAYTICASIATEDKSHKFQDLHCTEEQLRDLASLINRTLEANGELYVP